MIYAAIADWADEGEFSIRFMCRALGVSKSGYYRWASGHQSEHARRDVELTTFITSYFHKQKGRVGSRVIHAWLARQGHITSVRRVWRLMVAAGLVCCHPRKRVQTTVPDPGAPHVPDLVGRDFTATGPDRTWVGDISYIRVGTGWAYLATVIDVFNRKVVGFAIASHMRESLATTALSNALKRHGWPKNVIFHSDYAEVCVKPKNRQILRCWQGSLTGFSA